MKNFDLAQGREQLADAMWHRWLALNGAIALPPPGTATEGRKAQKVQPKT
jgi:hypothetical protein